MYLRSKLLSDTDKLSVAIVGAGVIGLTATVHLQERFPGKLDLTLIADKFSPHTTSDKSAAILWPILPERIAMSSQVYDVKKWIRISFQKFQSIFSSSDNAQVGISLLHGYTYFNSLQSEPWWKDCMFGVRRVENESGEAKTLSLPSNCVEIWASSTFTMNPTCFLQWLMGKAKKGGCKVENKRISSLEDLTHSYDIVINCTGLGSCKELLFDQRMYPVQGQVVVVKAPWVKHWLLDTCGSSTTCIIPRGPELVLGGTKVVGDWNETTDPDTLTDIIKRCQDLVPSLVEAEVVSSWAGLRPGRDLVRLEDCECQSGSLLIHCYGHHDKGICLSWGCAMDIGGLVGQRLTGMACN